MQKGTVLKPTALVILDDRFGYRKETNGNAMACAHMPFYKNCLAMYPHTYLDASGKAVGLPDRFIGNSQVGHRCIGAGRVVPSIVEKIHKAIADGTFFVPTILHYLHLKVPLVMESKTIF